MLVAGTRGTRSTDKLGMKAEPPENIMEKPPAGPGRRSVFRSLVSDVLFVTRRDKKWWLLPLILLLASLVALFAFAAGLGPLAPFVYSRQ